MLSIEITSLRRQFFCWATVFASILYLSGCGGGSGEGSSPVIEPTPPIVNSVGQGEFKAASPLKGFSVSDINSVIESYGASAALTAKYAVSTYRLTYLTIDGQGKEILASALAVIPQKSANALSPVLSYQHATITKDADAPSNLASAATPEVLLASLGYIVVSADYVGYGASKGAGHPYLLSGPSSAAVIDMLTAAKYWRQN